MKDLEAQELNIIPQLLFGLNTELNTNKRNFIHTHTHTHTHLYSLTLSDTK